MVQDNNVGVRTGFTIYGWDSEQSWWMQITIVHYMESKPTGTFSIN